MLFSFLSLRKSVFERELTRKMGLFFLSALFLFEPKLFFPVRAVESEESLSEEDSTPLFEEEENQSLDELMMESENASEDEFTLSSDAMPEENAVIENDKGQMFNQVVLRVNNTTLSQRELEFYFQLRGMSPYLASSASSEDMKVKMIDFYTSWIYIQENNLTNLITMDQQKRFLDQIFAFAGVSSTSELLEKIDPQHLFSPKVFLNFIDIQLAWNNLFLYLIETQFEKITFPLREDEIYGQYMKNKLEQNPAIYSPAEYSFYSWKKVDYNQDSYATVLKKIQALHPLFQEGKSGNIPAKERKNIKNQIQQILSEISTSVEFGKEIGPVTLTKMQQEHKEYFNFASEASEGDFLFVENSDGEIVNFVFFSKVKPKKLLPYDPKSMRTTLERQLLETRYLQMYRRFLNNYASTLDIHIF